MNKAREILESIKPVHESDKINVAKIEKLGAAFWADDDDVLFEAPMKTDGSIDWEQAGEVTAPESQEALDIIGDALHMHFKMSQFAGR